MVLDKDVFEVDAEDIDKVKIQQTCMDERCFGF